MGIIRNAWYGATGRKGYGKHMDRREGVAADRYLRGVLLKLDHEIAAREYDEENLRAEKEDISSAYSSFKSGQMSYSALRKAVDGIKKKRSGKVPTLDDAITKAAAAVLFLVLASSLFMPGTITCASVFNVADSNARNFLFIIGIV